MTLPSRTSRATEIMRRVIGLGAYLGDIDVEVADRIALEWLFGGLVARDLR